MPTDRPAPGAYSATEHAAHLVARLPKPLTHAPKTPKIAETGAFSRKCCTTSVVRQCPAVGEHVPAPVSARRGFMPGGGTLSAEIQYRRPRAADAIGAWDLPAGGSIVGIRYWEGQGKNGGARPACFSHTTSTSELSGHGFFCWSDHRWTGRRDSAAVACGFFGVGAMWNRPGHKTHQRSILSHGGPIGFFRRGTQ